MIARRVFALLVISMLGMGLAGPGCASGDPCSDVKDTVRIIDNRDGTYPEYPDWICLTIEGADDYTPPPPPPPPAPPPVDISVVSPPDPPGPKDSDAVINTAIAYISCYDDTRFYTVNRTIGGIYYTKTVLTILEAVYERTSCFKDMTAGCDTFRACMGIGTALEAPPNTVACNDGIAHIYGSLSTGPNVHAWKNCAALGYECGVIFDPPGDGFCFHPNLRDCDPASAPQCIDGDYYYCGKDDGSPTGGSTYDFPRCSDHGFDCWLNPDNEYAYCKAQGPACELSLPKQPNMFDYREGISCEGNTVLRTCIGGAEHLLDCTSLNPNFQCLSPEGSYKARCGIARECTESDDPTCDGTSLVVCDAGQIRKVDCTSLGFDSCDAKRGICHWKGFDNVAFQ